MNKGDLVRDVGGGVWRVGRTSDGIAYTEDRHSNISAPFGDLDVVDGRVIQLKVGDVVECGTGRVGSPSNPLSVGVVIGLATALYTVRWTEGLNIGGETNPHRTHLRLIRRERPSTLDERISGQKKRAHSAVGRLVGLLECLESDMDNELATTGSRQAVTSAAADLSCLAASLDELYWHRRRVLEEQALP